MSMPTPRANRKVLWTLLIVLPLLIYALWRSSEEQPGAHPPGPAAAASNPAETKPSAAEPAFELYTPDPGSIRKRPVSIQKIEGPGLAKTLYVTATELPMLDVRIVFDAGGARDGNSPGLASLVSALIPEGTRRKDSGQIAATFETVGASFNSGSYRDMATLELRTLIKPELMNPALDMLTELIREASFPVDALERERERVLAGLQQKRQNPSSLASDRFYADLYGAHPYAQPSDGTLESIPAISQQQIIDFYQTYYNRGNALIAMVGDIDAGQAQKIASKISAALPSGEPAPTPPVPTTLTAMQEARVAFPSAQAHLLLGAVGVSRTSDNLLALQLANEVLGGGGLVSMLSQEIREKRGMAYSAYSYFSPMRVAGPFTMGLQTRSDQAEEALRVARQTLRNFAADGPTQEQFQRAKQHLLGSFPLQTSSNRSIVGYLGAIGFYGLPLDYLETYTQRLEQVTRDQAAAAFREVIDPERLLIVHVGPGSETGDEAR